MPSGLLCVALATSASYCGGWVLLGGARNTRNAAAYDADSGLEDSRMSSTAVTLCHLFIAFELEIAFLFPWAVTMDQIARASWPWAASWPSRGGFSTNGRRGPGMGLGTDPVRTCRGLVATRNPPAARSVVQVDNLINWSRTGPSGHTFGLACLPSR